MLPMEDSHSGRVRASRTRVDESLEGSNPSSSAIGVHKDLATFSYGGDNLVKDVRVIAYF